MANKKSGLGKGLGQLFLENSVDELVANNTLPLEEIVPNKEQPRKTFDETALEELAESIRQHGVLQPLLVRPLPGGGYQLVAGERRYRASRIAGLREVPVVIRELSDVETMEIAIIENLQREDLNPMEEAAGFQSLIETYHMTQEEAAQRVGKSRSAVTNALRLLGLSPSVRKLVEENKLTAGHARALVPLSPSLQESAANAIIAGGLSVRQTEALVKRLSAEKKESKKPRNDEVDYLAEAQNELKAKLCRGVKIVSGRKKGRIELEYYGLDDLNDLLDALALIKINKAKEGPQA